LTLRIERLRVEEDSYSQQINEIDIRMENITNEYSSEKEELLKEKNELDNKEREIENKSVSALTGKFKLDKLIIFYIQFSFFF
jgi:hypothetical protein